ncbi:MAG TPA: hypothetical protein ENM97_04450 [Moorella mulderi]|nr:hypothetical protein [Moorella mulderi]
MAELQRQDAIRRDFVAAVSHELRTPLSIIQGYSEALLDGIADPEEVPRYLQGIKEEVERLSKLTAELLDLRRLETRAVEIKREKLHLQELAEEVVRRYENISELAGVEFYTELEPVPFVWGDRLRLEQVIGNLLDNAFRFTPSGGQVRLKVGPSPEGVVLEVKDTGIGIPPQDLPHIWDRFYRADKARSRISGGGGLGLAIVKQVVEIHGGRVEADSELGKGSTFRVILPRA